MKIQTNALKTSEGKYKKQLYTPEWVDQVGEDLFFFSCFFVKLITYIFYFLLLLFILKHSYYPGMARHSGNLIWKIRQEENKFKVSLGYIVSPRLAWATEQDDIKRKIT